MKEEKTRVVAASVANKVENVVVMKTPEKTPAVKVTVKEPVEKSTIKTEALKSTEKNKTEKKTTAVKKAAAEKTSAVKKSTVKKATAKKTEIKESMHLEFAGKRYAKEDLLKSVKDIWKYDYKKKAADLKSIDLYVKPEEGKAYYVINGEILGDFII